MLAPHVGDLPDAPHVARADPVLEAPALAHPLASLVAEDPDLLERRSVPAGAAVANELPHQLRARLACGQVRAHARGRRPTEPYLEEHRNRVIVQAFGVRHCVFSMLRSAEVSA